MIVLRSDNFAQWAEHFSAPLVKYLAVYLESPNADPSEPVGIDSHAFALGAVLLQWGKLGGVTADNEGKEDARRLLCVLLRNLSNKFASEKSHTYNNGT